MFQLSINNIASGNKSSPKSTIQRIIWYNNFIFHKIAYNNVYKIYNFISNYFKYHRDLWLVFRAYHKFGNTHGFPWYVYLRTWRASKLRRTLTKSSVEIVFGFLERKHYRKHACNHQRTWQWCLELNIYESHKEEVALPSTGYKSKHSLMRN